MCMRMTLTGPKPKSRRLLQITGTLLCCHQHSSAAITHDATVEQVQRVSNHARIEHILHRNWLTIHRQRVESRVPPGDDSNFGELFGGRAVLVHMPSRCHSIRSHKRIAIGSFIGSFGNCRWSSARANHPSTAGELVAGIGNQCYLALAPTNRHYRMIEVGLEGGAADGCRIAVAWK